MVVICGYEFPTNLQTFMQKDLTRVKIFPKVLGATFLKHPVYHDSILYYIGYHLYSGHSGSNT